MVEVVSARREAESVSGITLKCDKVLVTSWSVALFISNMNDPVP